MAEKIGSGSWHEGPSPTSDPRAGRDETIERLTQRRDNARWSAVVGFALLFGASFSSAFLFGGVAMILYGVSASMVWSLRLRKLQGDPWAYDPELDGPSAPDWSRTGKRPPDEP